MTHKAVSQITGNVLMTGTEAECVAFARKLNGSRYGQKPRHWSRKVMVEAL